MTYMLLYRVLDLIFQGLYWLLMGRVLLSWIPHNPHQQLIQYVYRFTDPLLRPFQDIVPTYRFGIDFAPIFAFLALSLVRKLLFNLLF